jgi:tetratricopeptide (TPR) repeat protein
MNAEEGEGETLAEEYEIQGYPTFVALNANGDTIGRWYGYGAASEFISTLGAVVTDPATIDERRARFEAEPAEADAALLGRYHVSRNEHDRAIDYFRKAVELSGGSGEYQFDLFMANAAGYFKETIPLEEIVGAADRAMESGGLAKHHLLGLASVMSRVGGKSEEWLARPYAEAALAATETGLDPDYEKLRLGLAIDYAFHVEGDEQKAVALKRESMPEGWLEDAGQLNEFAWWCFEKETNLVEAERLARKGVELAEEGDQKAMILDTVAEIAYLNGETEEALALMRRAVEQDPETEHYREQIERFRSD